MVDAIVLSDIHLGSDNCQAESLLRLLKEIHLGLRPAGRLILNGDVFDSIDFRRLKKKHWKVLSQLRRMSDDMDIIWINGNHDGPAEFISPLLGVEIVEEFVLESGGERILLLHGHRFDEFIDRYPITTWLADRAYRWLQRFDRTHTIARTAKRSSKLFLRCAKLIEERSARYARSRDCDAVCCGHTHHAEESFVEGVRYYNSGCWTEKPCHYLVIDNGAVAIESFEPAYELSEAAR